MPGMRRIAVLDHASAGGVSRFLLALLTHLAQQHKDDLSIDYFVASGNIERDDLVAAFAPFGNVRLVPIRGAFQPVAEQGTHAESPRRAHGPAWRWASSLVAGSPRIFELIKPLYRFLRGLPREPKPWYYYRLDSEVVEQLRTYDLVYIAWPYFIEPVDLGIPVVATFHDFHYRLFPEAYAASQLRLVEQQTPEWLQRCSIAVSSSQFIKSQLLGYYSDVAPDVEVVYLAPYGFQAPEPAVVQETLARLGVRHPYVLYSGARSAHKNVAAIARAIGILRSQGTSVQLVITGYGTDVIGDAGGLPQDDPVHLIEAAIAEYGLVRNDDYLALGYVSNQDVDALTAGADAIVSASLYEAGCGPAMDAWQAGVPVVFSDIPPFAEQLTRSGVKAWVFDPHDPSDIAEKIRGAVFETELASEMVELSKEASASYVWDDVARGYYRVFCKAIELGRCSTER